jgi:hypothetical protein
MPQNGGAVLSSYHLAGHQDETIEPALAPKTFGSGRLGGDDGMHSGLPEEHDGVWSRMWYEARQWVVDKYYDKNFKFMMVLLFLVIAFGTVNRVIYKIQLYISAALFLFLFFFFLLY